MSRQRNYQQFGRSFAHSNLRRNTQHALGHVTPERCVPWTIAIGRRGCARRYFKAVRVERGRSAILVGDHEEGEATKAVSWGGGCVGGAFGEVMGVYIVDCDFLSWI